MIDRRTLLRVAGAVFVSATGPLRVQAQGRPARVAYLSFRREPNEFEQAFLRGLRERGFIEGGNLVIDFRWAAWDLQRAQAMVTELGALQPGVFVVVDAMGRAVIPMIRSLYPAMPIVVPALGDPIAAGLTHSLASPDGNVTGIAVFTIELSHKRLQLLKEAVPTLKRVGALYNAARRDNPPEALAATAAAGKELGIEVVEMPVPLPEGIDAAFAAAARQGVQGVAIVSDTATIAYRQPLGELSLKHRLPTIFSNRTYLKGGGLMSYGPDLEGAFHRSAYFVERILKGAKPAELPIERPTTFQLALNLGTARSMGFKFPQSLLARADEVIE